MAIPEKTQACVSSLKSLRDLAAAPQAQRTWAEDQLARLNLWADSLGIFAQGEFSINHRLAKNRQVTRLVEQLVEALSGNIAAYRGAIAQEPAQLAEQPSQAGAEDDTVNSDGEVSYSEMSDEDNIAPIPSKLATEVEKSVGRLLQLAIRVRREGARKTAAEAAKFEPRDENGRHLAPEFGKYIQSVCQRAFNTTQDAGADARQLHGNERYEAAPFLQQRAEKCMVDRWRRVSYQRHHASNLADPSKRTTAKPETQKPKTKPGAPPSVGRDSGRLQSSTAAKDAHVPAASKAVSTATVLSARVKIDQKIDPHPKTAPTVTTKVRADHLEFPRAPKVRDGLDEFKCPLCGLPCSTSQLEKKKWQLHVMHDLMPYFCLFEECTQPHLTFQTTEDWSNHAKAEHARTSWACQICRSSGSSDKLSTFHHEDDYRQHLERAHGSIAANKLSLVIQMSCYKEPPIYPCCVFCGFLPEAHLRDVESDMCQREIISHMAKSHLQPFALDSLPWDVAGGEHAESGRVSGSSATNSNDEDIKQQIMNDPRLGEFEVSVPETETLGDQNGSVQQMALQASNFYAASLDEIGRRSSVKDDQSRMDRIGEWCNNQKTMAAYYIVTDRDRLLGTEETVTGWADMDKDAPETISQVEGPQNSALSRMQGGEMPQRLDRKHSIVPPAMSGVPSIAEDPAEDNDNDSESESDVTEENVLTDDEKQFLEIAARGDRDGLAEFLSNRTKYFDFNCTDSEDRNAVHLALLSSCPSLIDDLAKAGCDVDYWSLDFGTPLCLAVARENVEAVEALLRYSAEVDKCNFRQSSALHLACFFQNEGLVRLLLNHGAKIEQSLPVTFTEVRALRDSELDGDGGVSDEESVTSLDSLLWTFESRTDSIRGTPLAISAFFGHVGITKLLLGRGASVEEKATWTETQDRSVLTATPLLIACRAGMSQVVEVLLAAGADIDQIDSYDDTAATNAVCAESLETLEVLMRHAPCAEDRRTHFAQALKRAARNGHADVVRFFLEKGLEPDASDDERTPLIAASFKGRYEVVAMLLEAGASVHKTDSEGQSALHNAASGGHTQVLELLIKSGSKVDLQDNDQSTPLMVTRDADDPACMLLLLDSGANIDMCDEEGNNALAYAASRNRDKHAQVLLERGANIEATDNDGWTALTYAAIWDHIEMIELLIDKGADVNHQSGEELDTALTLAAQHGSVKAAEVLIDNGALLEAKNQKGNTALFEACEANEVDVLKLLIGRGCRMDGEDSKGDTVLLKTVNAGHIECLQILIEAGATAGPSHRVWELALLLAAEKGNVACLRLLLLKVSPDVTNEDGMTGLMLAVAEGRLECARLLLDAETSIDSTDSSGKTALHHAAAHNAPECTKLLLDRGANHSCRDRDGRTPLLLLAAEESASEAENCVAALVDAGAPVNDKDYNGTSALWLAAHEGHPSVLEALCFYDNLDKDAFDRNGHTALIHAAISPQRFRKTEILIAAGANLHLQKPSDGRNALAYALSFLSFRAAVALMQAGSDLSMVVTATSSTTLLEVKTGFDVMPYHYCETYRDLFKANLRQVVTQLGVLKQARDPVVALTPHQKQRLVKWARSAKQKIRSRRKHKSVSFATIETPEMMAEAGSQSVSEYSSGSESGSFSESDDGEHSQTVRYSSNGASSDEPESDPSTAMLAEESKTD